MRLYRNALKESSKLISSFEYWFAEVIFLSRKLFLYVFFFFFGLLVMLVVSLGVFLEFQ